MKGNRDYKKLMESKPKPPRAGEENTMRKSVSPEKSNIVPEESRLVNVLRNIEWGEVKVVVKNGKPVMVTESLKDTKLTD